MVKRKRVVLYHTTGRLAGLHAVMGVLEGSHAETDAPTSIQYGLNGKQTAHHERTNTRYIQYRERAQLSVGKFNEFNPAQV